MGKSFPFLKSLRKCLKLIVNCLKQLHTVWLSYNYFKNIPYIINIFFKNLKRLKGAMAPTAKYLQSLCHSMDNEFSILVRFPWRGKSKFKTKFSSMWRFGGHAAFDIYHNDTYQILKICKTWNLAIIPFALLYSNEILERRHDNRSCSY